MKAVIHQTFCHIKGCYLVCLLIFIREDTLVHARPVIGQVQGLFQFLLDVISIQHCQFAYFFQVLRPQAQDIAVGLDQNVEMAVKGEDPTDTLWNVRKDIFPPFFHHSWHRQKRREVFFHRHRPGPWPAPSVRG